MPLTHATHCPVAHPVLDDAGLAGRRRNRPPRPEGLSYSFTLPGEPHCAATARTAVRSALYAHGLAPYTDLAELAATELMGTAVKLTPGRELYLSLRCRTGALRLVLWDQHPRHTNPDDVSVCAERRRGALWLLAAMVGDCGGEWGTAEAEPPQRGVKSWAVLPRRSPGLGPGAQDWGGMRA
ncbi:ATP-binding protein [Streptomyces scopuliridis]|uniref:ATP-binding protein n=1 Tax=Streptomyces scopuliridis TaxID=452529 RepID=UPI003675D28C